MGADEENRRGVVLCGMCAVILASLVRAARILYNGAKGLVFDKVQGGVIVVV